MIEAARGLAIRAEWRPLTARAAAEVPGATGVYELRCGGNTVLIAYAGARTRFGLRGVLAELAAARPGHDFRAEVTTAYLSRWRELLGWQLGRTGRLPVGNEDVPGIRPIGTRRPR